MKEVAVKINRNTAFDHTNSRIEIGILKKIKDGAMDENDSNSLMKDYKSKIVKI